MALTSDSEFLRAWLGGHDVPCPVCGYNLRGLPAGVCPECGNSLRLTVTAISSKRWSWPIAIGTLAGMAAFQALLAVSMVTSWLAGASIADLWADLLVSGIMLVVIAGYLHVCIKCRRAIRGARP
jgi:hypothetical protein